jgi:hypothetical protein
MLEYPIRWLLNELFPEYAINFSWADLSRVTPRRTNLADRIRIGLELFPCDLLFVHRDAEGDSYDKRVAEIQAALQHVGKQDHPHIPVIPTRMTEAWFLHDEQAIRLAAGNPNGSMQLHLPDARRVHTINDPKQLLERLLIQATGLNKRRLKHFKPRREMHRLAELVEDYNALRQQESFQRLEASLEGMRLTIFI